MPLALLIIVVLLYMNFGNVRDNLMRRIAAPMIGGMVSSTVLTCWSFPRYT